MSVDITFDNIAQSYSVQRAHPPHVSINIGQAIAAVTGSSALVLELGVGTGRIAHPVAATGIRVVGIDIAREMLRVAQEHNQPPLALAQGDIAFLPFVEHAFDAVLAVHVLHLVPDWRGVLHEIKRVLKPGGVFIQGRDWRDPQSAAERLRAKLREAVMELVPGSRPPGAGAAIPQALAKLGGIPAQEIIAAEWTTHVTLASMLSRMAERADAETWALDDNTLQAAIGRVRAFAVANYHNLEDPHEIAQRFVVTPVHFE